MYSAFIGSNRGTLATELTDVTLILIEILGLMIKILIDYAI